MMSRGLAGDFGQPAADRDPYPRDPHSPEECHPHPPVLSGINHCYSNNASYKLQSN